ECNRITTGIMQAISWCLMQKGVKSGEITVDFASEKKNRLTDNELFSEDLNCDPEPLPKEFINYSERTRALYIRIVRIDRLLYENNGSIENPVHNMMNKIEKI
ncbi:MAG: DUF1465 family protein, partial [Kordiimonadaceae bacterium]|nr:DUF1465 family protein [Kordiimonadaceae bacterium]